MQPGSVDGCFAQKVSFGTSLLCGPLCSLLSLRLTVISTQRPQRYTERRRENESDMRLFVQSHSDMNWWSELESNQPFELFRLALIHLSYPTVFLWGSWQDSNPQLRRSKRRTLPVELQEHEIGARGETRTHVYRICNPAP